MANDVLVFGERACVGKGKLELCAYPTTNAPLRAFDGGGPAIRQSRCSSPPCSCGFLGQHTSWSGHSSSPPSLDCIPASSVVTSLPFTSGLGIHVNCIAGKVDRELSLPSQPSPTLPNPAVCLHRSEKATEQHSSRLGAFLAAATISTKPSTKMRAALLILPAVALAAPDFAAPFQPAQLQQSPAQSNDTLVDDAALDLLKRQYNPNACASGYQACTNINQPGLCCRNTETCSIDGAGHAACCPNGSACTGTIAAITQGTSPTTTGAQTAVPTGATTTITVTPGTSTSFVQGSAGATSWVPNTFFPFAYLPTTYKSAAACSSAYSRCHSDAARCTAALAGGQNFGVTVSAPNGGVTITAVPTLGSVAASSICSSLSQAACSGDWNVQACSNYGPGDGSSAGRCGVERYGVGAGVAIGVMGGLLR